MIIGLVTGVAIVVLACAVLILTAYAIRHYALAIRRLVAGNPRDPFELRGFVMPRVSVLIPMHNEERVAADVLNAVIEADYDRNLLEVIVVNDRSSDATGAILDDFASRYPFISVIHRRDGKGGKPRALIEGTRRAKGDVLLLFDADYVPARTTLKDLVVPFCDPQVGAVMGRVIPGNATATMLAALLELERAAGYQVGQQARHELRLTPQFGGTVGGVRAAALKAVGGWNPASLTEDTDLTYRLLIGGWKITYVNRAECYEEAPESWPARRRQIARWATGHTECFHRFWYPIIRSSRLTLREKLDAVIVLGSYLTAPVIVAGWCAAVWLLLFSSTPIVLPLWVALTFVGFQLFGSQATFVELGAAALLDRNRYRVLLLPATVLSFFATTVAICGALLRYYVGGQGLRLGAGRKWDKTERFRVNGNGSHNGFNGGHSGVNGEHHGTGNGSADHTRR